MPIGVNRRDTFGHDIMGDHHPGELRIGNDTVEIRQRNHPHQFTTLHHREDRTGSRIDLFDELFLANIPDPQVSIRGSGRTTMSIVQRNFEVVFGQVLPDFAEVQPRHHHPLDSGGSSALSSRLCEDWIGFRLNPNRKYRLAQRPRPTGRDIRENRRG